MNLQYHVFISLLYYLSIFLNNQYGSTLNHFYIDMVKLKDPHHSIHLTNISDIESHLPIHQFYTHFSHADKSHYFHHMNPYSFILKCTYKPNYFLSPSPYTQHDPSLLCNRVLIYFKFT